MNKKFLLCFLCLICFFLFFVTTAMAHSGRTDSSGGHYDHSTGIYHYHHGYSAHKHENGVCPYDKESSTVSTSIHDEKKSAITPFDEIPVLKIVLDFFLIALHFVCSSMVSLIISMCLSALLLCVPFVKKKFENSQNKVFIGCFVFVSALMLFFIMFALGDTSLIDVLQFIGDTFWIYLRRIILALLSALITYFICQDTDNKLTYILVFIILCFVLEILVSLAATVF